MRLLHGLAAAGPVPVFAAVGLDARERVEALSLSPEVRLAASPRHASVLLVAGKIRSADQVALKRLHDQLPHPRATLWWTAEAPRDMAAAVTLPVTADPLPALRGLYRRLLAGEYASERHLLADEPPTPWRGRGEHGQGGEGMMGGRPYGRPMAMPDDDLRDGLALDACTTRIGPFLPQLPPGLVLELTLQGDVIQSAKVVQPPLPPSATAAALFLRALQQPVSVAVLERARAAHHLCCIARLLVLLQSPALAARCRQAVQDIERGASPQLGNLVNTLIRVGAFAALPAGLGELDRHVAEQLGGAALRAAGEPVDARSRLSIYRAYDFQPITQRYGDSRARLHQWLDEARQALALAERAASAAPAAFPEGLEAPWGELSVDGAQPRLKFCFTELLRGLEWSEAMLLVASFDVATLRRMAPAEEDKDKPVEAGDERGGPHE